MELVPKVVSQIFNLGDDADNQLSLESSEVGKMLTNGFEVGILCFYTVIFKSSVVLFT